MPRTVDGILAQADELAARFEGYEPKASDELDAGAAPCSGLLSLSGQQPSDTSWKQSALPGKLACRGQLSAPWSGTTGEAARQRYTNRVA